MRKPTKRSLTAKLDRLASLKAREAAKNHCEHCGRPATQVHHVHSRRFRRLRWDERNLVSICAACHRFAHDRPAQFLVWFADHRPEAHAYLCDPESHAPVHVTVGYLEDELERLEFRA